jgi:NitT/TauT family transport system substrate-binding protein
VKSKLFGIAISLSLLTGCSITNSPNDIQNSNQLALESSTLNPAPLSEPTLLRISIAGNFEFMSALFVADQLGELRKENITIEYVTMPSQEALPALALGQIDVAFAGITSNFFNSVYVESGIKLVMPGASGVEGDGLWLRSDLVGNEQEEKISLGASQGLAWPGVVVISRYLESVGLTWDDVEVQRIPIGDLSAALELGAVDAAWLNSPAHLPFEESGKAQLVGKYDSGEVATGLIFGKRLLQDEPMVGQALVRALIRTIDTHLSDSYKSNKKVLDALSDSLGVDASSIADSPELIFTLGFNESLFEKSQRFWIDTGGIVEFTEPIDSELYLDSRFVNSIDY